MCNITCPAGLKKYFKERTCLINCIVGSYEKSPTECLPCHESCLTCNEGLSSNCTSCIEDRAL